MPARIDPAVVAEVALFRGPSSEELSGLATRLHERIFPAGASVLAAGQPGEAAYVLLRGSIKVCLFTLWPS